MRVVGSVWLMWPLVGQKLGSIERAESAEANDRFVQCMRERARMSARKNATAATVATVADCCNISFRTPSRCKTGVSL